MSYRLTVENRYGEQLELTRNPNYKVTATGLNPVVSDIITTSVANQDGEKFVTSKKQKRNIVLTIYLEYPVEKNRLNLYKHIKSKDFIRVYVKTSSRDVFIDGYVESFELDHFEIKQTAQVSIICPQSNFIDVNSLEATNSNVVKGFYYPFNTEIKESAGTELIFNGLGDGVVKFSDFMAVPKLSTQSATPTPDNPVDFTGLGEVLNGAYYTRLSFDTAGSVREVSVPLGEQKDGVNLIKGGAGLVCDYNYFVGNVLTDNSGAIYLDENNNILMD